MSDRLLEITFSVEHENCWTNLVGKYVVKTLRFSVDTERNFIRSLIVVDKKYKDLMNKIKRNTSFVGYSSISLTNDSKKILFDFRKRYKNSVMDVINSVDGIILDGFKYDGKEYWRILLYESYINELREKLRSKGIVEFIGFHELNVTEDELTPYELKTLILAYKNGYFDFPRRIKSDKISKLINISKSTFTYHLRSAESRIIKRYIDDLKFYNVINNVSQQEEERKDN
ncbi:Bacterio-opsin activator domain-containing protein [Saccharolobus shibatae B12]|uniref:Bacterio-opsin activator domain-containing protein n=1 Tax=Saccharolobus shibatae (strain ATCC 51178 / DSM 5389 / JCM 8931 / NBRC 15437 / B12) TaxID=523848 RepID=A0A8F5BPM9_SACSH|nr:helix-turn-helix domain-containing protein [Saccharolobus shibatae]QXJ29137.1 Bacterio-opsin activator domain-containing protein [Saccharolobus shibatae B12]